MPMAGVALPDGRPPRAVRTRSLGERLSVDDLAITELPQVLLLFAGIARSTDDVDGQEGFAFPAGARCWPSTAKVLPRWRT